MKNIDAAAELIKNGTFSLARQEELRIACDKHSKSMMHESTEASTFLKTKLLLPFAKMNKTTNTLIRADIKNFRNHISIITKHIDHQYSAVKNEVPKEEKKGRWQLYQFYQQFKKTDQYL